MKILVDHCVAPALARSINGVVQKDGHLVEALVDQFGRSDISDITWMSQLGTEGGWWILTDDHRIRRNPAELKAFKDANLRGLFLAPAYRKVSTIEKTGRLLMRWSYLEALEPVLAPGSMILVPIRGQKLKTI